MRAAFRKKGCFAAVARGFAKPVHGMSSNRKSPVYVCSCGGIRDGCDALDQPGEALGTRTVHGRVRPIDHREDSDEESQIILYCAGFRGCGRRPYEEETTPNQRLSKRLRHLVGAPNARKSTLLNAILKERLRLRHPNPRRPGRDCRDQASPQCPDCVCGHARDSSSERQTEQGDGAKRH